MWLQQLHPSDWILLFTFFAIVWYSWETRQLRKWQQKQVQLSIVDLDMQRVRSNAEGRGNPTPYGEAFPIIMRKIYDSGNFDPKVLYSPTYHQPLTLTGRIRGRINSLWKRV